MLRHSLFPLWSQTFTKTTSRINLVSNLDNWPNITFYWISWFFLFQSRERVFIEIIYCLPFSGREKSDLDDKRLVESGEYRIKIFNHFWLKLVVRFVVILDHYFGLTVNDFAESFLENTGKYFIYLSRNSIIVTLKEFPSDPMQQWSKQNPTRSILTPTTHWAKIPPGLCSSPNRGLIHNDRSWQLGLV